MIKEGSKLIGFIQNMSLSPIYVHFFNEVGVRLLHDIGKKKPLFLDATGSIVKNKRSEKAFLYYQLCCQNPQKGGSLIPLAGMISNCQNEPCVTNFLSAVRHAEKQLYGYASLSQLVQVNVDFSMVLITSVLKCLNTQTLANYLDRC